MKNQEMDLELIEIENMDQILIFSWFFVGYLLIFKSFFFPILA